MFSTAIETQQGLNEVARRKVERMISGHQESVSAAVTRMLNEGKLAQDFIAPLGVNLRRREERPKITFEANGHVMMNLENEQYNIHDNAISQIAEKMNIPARYLKELATGDEWKRQLCAEILNEHSGWTDRNRVLIRSVGNEVRAVLSDSYRRLNSIDIVSAYIEEAKVQGGVLADGFMSDTKVWFETILPEPITIPTVKNGDIILYAGARMSTSDYGNGSVELRAFLLNGVCLNGMVRESIMKQVHLGSKLPDNLIMSEKTYRLDTETTVSAVRDFTKALFSEENIMQKAIEIQQASNIEVDMTQELKGLAQKGWILKNEAEEVQKVLMRNDPEDGVAGGSTLWKLSQGLTAYARELEPDRKRIFAEISGNLLDRIKA